MSGNHADIGDKAVPSIEKAPDVGLVVRFNGMQLPVMMTVGETQTLNFGTFPVEIKVVQVVRKKPRPTSGPPYTFIIKHDGGETRIRSNDEANAERIFRQRSQNKILSIEAEIV